ncbi:MAG: discoidin domain-containing protein [Flavitalea sp.]
MKAFTLCLMALFARLATFSQCTDNIALGTVATASSVNGSSYAGLAIDGNGTSRWESNAADPQNIDLDLGAQYNICRVIIKWETASARDFTIQVSNDGVSWSVVGTVTNNAVLTNTFNLTTSGRYVRMLGTSRTTGYGYSIYEFEVYGNLSSGVYCPTTNFAAGKTSMSSTNNGANTAARAFDGNMSTRWESVAADPQWIYVDLGSVNDICKVTLQWEAAYGRNFTIDISNNASAWTTVKTIMNNTSTLNNIPLAVTGRYIRMMGTTRATGFGYSLYEFQAFGGLNVLPAPIADFRATASSASVRLDWSTTIEKGSSHFEVERSVDNGRTFERLVNLNSNGNSSYRRNYSWTDLSPAAGENFYRLKIVDVDGAFTYSDIVRGSVKTGAAIVVYYDRNGDVAKLRNASASAKIQLFDLSGNMIVSLKNKPSGIYIVRVTDGAEVVVSRIVRP